jgi:putative transposase
VKAKLALSERTYRCDCGLVMNRDVNAARNLLNLAASGAERQNACGAQIRPGLAGHRAMKQEPGTARGQDRDRRPATGGCGKGAYSCSLTRNGTAAFRNMQTTTCKRQISRHIIAFW